VEFTAADFSLYAKAAQVGATLTYNAPSPECQVVTATGATLTIDTENGVPVAQAGYSTAYCYVQEVGVAGNIATTGKAYPISEGGLITGFTATADKTYKVFYFVSKAGSQMATISSLFNPQVLHFTAQIPVFSNENCNGSDEGSRAGWLYIIVPRLKLGGNAGITGDQTTNDTTSLSGQAVAFDEDVVSATCSDCNSSSLAYYIYVPDDQASQIAGLAVVGGLVSVPVSGTAQIPVRLVMANGQLVTPGSYATGFTYTDTGAPSGTSVSDAGVVTAGTTAGDFEVTISYDNEGETLTTPVNVSVVSA
jgi:hypothetical protein